MTDFSSDSENKSSLLQESNYLNLESSIIDKDSKM